MNDILNMVKRDLIA